MSTRWTGVQTLLGRKVWDAQGNHLGRVCDLVAEQRGQDLCVVALLVGLRSWRTRFGWTYREYGRRIEWTDIGQLEPDIRLISTK